MNDLAEFLLARIAEDEAVAKSAAPGPWRIARSEDGRYAEVVSPANSLTDVVVLGAGGEFCGDLWLAADEADLVHIARWDPARVLAKCRADRRIVEWCSERTRVFVGRLGDDPTDPANYVPGDFAHRDDAAVLRLLAAPYADHPDYRPEWRP